MRLMMKIFQILKKIPFVVILFSSHSAYAQNIPAFDFVDQWIFNYSDNSCQAVRHYSYEEYVLNVRLVQDFSPFLVSIEIESNGPSDLLKSDSARMHIGEKSVSSVNFYRTTSINRTEQHFQGRWRNLEYFRNRQGDVELELVSQGLTVANIRIGSLDPALAGLRNCQDQLYGDNGISAREMRRVAYDAIPRGQTWWVTTDDLPAQFQSMYEIRRSRLRIGVSPEGRAVSCAIQSSSGEPILDDEACRSVLRRARYFPAYDSAGIPIATIHEMSVNWRGNPPPIPPPALPPKFFRPSAETFESPPLT